MSNINIKESLYRAANALAVITIVYNIAEGAVSMWFGYADGTLVLFGFGIDSVVEVISGVGVWHMIRRIRNSSDAAPDEFERRALRITGTAFYLLFVGLAVSAVVDLVQGHRPETTVWGIIVSCASIASMWLLIHYKVKVGKQLNSQAILADAACTRVCLYLSVILLLASAGYELTGIGSLDAIGTMFIAFFSIKEGREAFAKAKGIPCGCGNKCGSASIAKLTIRGMEKKG